MTRPPSYSIPLFLSHHPDESHPAMSLTFFLDGLCHSLGTVQIVVIFTGRTTTQNLSKDSDLKPGLMNNSFKSSG
jgi:hypothetical protein